MGTTLQVLLRYAAVKGNYLAAAVTLNLFLSLLPLLLVAIAIVGFVTSSHSDLPDRIISNMGLSGQLADSVHDALDHAATTRKAASLIGLVGLTWSGLGVVAAIEYALDATWQVAGRGFLAKLRGIAWGAGALVLLGASIALTALIDLLTSGFFLQAGSFLVAIAINAGFWMWTFLVLTHERRPWRAYVPGAVLAGVGLEVIKQLVSALPGLFTNASALYGSLGATLALLTVLMLLGRLIVYASILNVVRWEEDHGTVTVDVQVPKVAGQVPLEADRSGAIELPVDEDARR